ncbi:hypothetical protein OG206_16215 [Streptomyces sp. NBC_01341]|uniref:hypothetical protein n=1 Tax=Streptomyces sp. NBC_01341 TaxID=2903831 RepID=UPI002E166702|nr:hypothetical protein OG206_16215 [Streptomyces sp. NBC_01341]
MTSAKLSKLALAATVLAAVTACGASSAPDGDGSASATTAPMATESRAATHAPPAGALVPDVIGGNAGRV